MDEVICKLCKNVKKTNDCWCCIDRGNRHYECKVKCVEDPPRPPRVVPLELTHEIREPEPSKIPDWELTPRPKGFLNTLISFFVSEPRYTKLKTN
jgi:hypothetical protein